LGNFRARKCPESHGVARGTALAMGAAMVSVALSRREHETLACLLTGLSEKQVAARLGLSPHTVHQYVKALYRKLAVSSRAELMARCLGGGGPPPTR
jgi:DNA-binding CsgD family transcriptional regulator